MLRFDVITIFPGMFVGFLAEGVMRIAREKGLVEVGLTDLRDFTHDAHRSVDDRPYGGGPGMVMKCQPIFDAVAALTASGGPARLVLLTPQGRRFDHALAVDLAGASRVAMICGRYEGLDERIRLGLRPEEVSVGDFVLSGGEVAAMVIMEAVTRLVPGTLGHPGSAADDSFSTGLLEFPQYTRPAEYRGMVVPPVLLSGDHREVDRWRRAQALERTRERRKDLLK